MVKLLKIDESVPQSQNRPACLPRNLPGCPGAENAREQRKVSHAAFRSERIDYLKITSQVHEVELRSQYVSQGRYE